ncbi:MAG: insulinase family protein [Taibaiella sp.]|nr:insulinase family protein [Taibaiella sp.]
MKKIITSVIISVLAAHAWSQPLDRSVRPKPGPAPVVKLGNIESFTLANGLRVFVVENHKVPTIQCDIQFDIKPALQGNEAGYKSMLSELLLTGTKSRSNDQLNESIDFVGASIFASDDEIYGGALTKHEDKLLELLADITTNTVFKLEELGKVKTRLASGLEAQKNDPDAMLRNVRAALVYGPAHPYGEVITPATVNNVTLKTLDFYYNTYFRPNVAYMAIVGDVTVDKIKPVVEKYFGKWQKAEVPTISYAYYPAPQATKVIFVPREGSVQSVINVTYPIDLKKGTDDVIKARVANSILGDGSQGRLFLDLREKHAWTYGSYSILRDDNLVGSFLAIAKCRNIVTDSSVGAILHNMDSMRNVPVPQENLQNSIVYMSGNFALALEDPNTIARFAINTERYHMPKDYYSNYLKNLGAVTPADVQLMSRKYIAPDNAYIIVVGAKEEAGKLAKYSKTGEISYYDNYGKPIKVAEMTAAPAGMTANDVMQKYIAALGGENTINGIKDLKTVYSGLMSIPAQDMSMVITRTEVRKAPNMYVTLTEGTQSNQTTPMGKRVYNGKTGYSESGDKKKDITGTDLDDLAISGDLAAFLHDDKYGVKRLLRGIEPINGSDAYVVTAENKTQTNTEYYDTKTGLLVKKVQAYSDGAKVYELSNYKEVAGTNGFKVPYVIKTSLQGTPVTLKAQTVEANKGISDALFN